MTARDGRRQEIAQRLWPGGGIEEAGADEGDEVVELGAAEVDRRREEGIEAVELVVHGGDVAEVRVEVVGCVGGDGGADVEVVGDRVLEVDEGAVVEEGRLQRDISERGGPEGVAIGRIAGDLLKAEILVDTGAVEDDVASSG